MTSVAAGRRRAPRHLFPNRVTVQRSTTTQSTTTWQTHLASVPTRIETLASRTEAGLATRIVRRWRLFIGAEHDVTLRDRVKIGQTLASIRDLRDLGGELGVLVLQVEEILE